MATALENVAGLNVESMQRSPNQAATLEAFHAVKIDSVAALAEGTQVTYTDPILGLVFVGKITDVKKAYEPGEGVRYTCADAYRTLAKQAALIDIPAGGRSTRIILYPGSSMNDAIAAIFSGSRLTSIIPGGLDNDMDDVVLPMLDRAGQTVDSWLDELLRYTDDGIAYIQHVASPKLRIRPYSDAADVTLTQGTYNIITPSGSELVLEGGTLGKSLNRKYQRVSVEGCGVYTRHTEEYLPPEVTKVNDYEYHFKWYIPGTPGKRIVCRYIDPETGGCGEKCSVKVRGGESSGDPDTILFGRVLWQFDNPNFKTEEDGRVSWTLICYIKGWYGESGAPSAPNFSAWFTYTTWDGGLFATEESTDPKLEGEGEYVEQHEEYVKYTGPGVSVDQTSLLAAIASALATRYCGAADTTGSFRVHVNELNEDIDLGSRITNFGNCRVQSISYDFKMQSMTLSLSDVPLREEIELKKKVAKVKTLEGNNWLSNKNKYTSNCFCTDNASTTSVSSSGNPSDPTEPDDPEKATWDCNPGTGLCEERTDGKGMFNTEQDCIKDCQKPGWKAVHCVGCVMADDFDAQYATLGECEDDNPVEVIFDGCKYRCDPGLGCVAGEVGPYNTLAQCEADCHQTGSGGYGGSGSGVSAPAAPPGPGSGAGSQANTIEVLVDAYCDEETHEIVKTYRTITLR